MLLPYTRGLGDRKGKEIAFSGVTCLLTLDTRLLTWILSPFGAGRDRPSDAIVTGSSIATTRAKIICANCGKHCDLRTSLIRIMSGRSGPQRVHMFVAV